MIRVSSWVTAVVSSAAQRAGRARWPQVTSVSTSLLQRGLRLICWEIHGEKSGLYLYPGIQGGHRLFLVVRTCQSLHARLVQAWTVFCDYICWPPHTTDRFLTVLVSFPLKLQIINGFQHLQEIKACSPASRCRSRRLGHQASNINISAALGANASRDLHEQNYNCRDYHSHLWDSLGNTSGLALHLSM